jgi:hypothetical protein
MKPLLNPFARSFFTACSLLVGSLLLHSGAAQASSRSEEKSHSSHNDDRTLATLTTPLAVTGGRETDLLRKPGAFNPTWYGDATDYFSTYDFSHMRKGGTLLLTQPATVTYTLVGFEASFNNAFVSGSERLDNRTNRMANLGDSFSFSNLSTGALDFGFLSNGLGALRSNGSKATGLILADDRQSALIVFNDHRIGDRDFDDMVIRVSLISAVPEPETVAMLLAGLGLLAMTRRRQRRA